MITKRIVGLAAVTFFVSIAGGLSGPVFPLYAQFRGASYSQVGAIAASASVLHALLAFPFGRLADIVGPELIFLFSAISVSLSAVIYPIARTVAMLALGKTLDSLCLAAFWPAMETASTTGKETAGHSMGIIYTVFPIAVFLGSSAGGWLAGAFGYQAAFHASLSAGLVAMVGVASGWWVPRTWRQRLGSLRRGGQGVGYRAIQAAGRAEGCSDRHTKGPADSGAPGYEGCEIRSEARGPRVYPGARLKLALAAVSCLSYCLIVGLMWTFVPLLADVRGLRVELVGLLVGMFWVGRVAISLAAGAVSERAGRGAVIVPALLVGAAGTAVLAYGQSEPVMFAGVSMMGLCTGALAPASLSLGSDCVPNEYRGWAMGLCETFCGLGFLVIGAAGGILGEIYGPSAPFVATAAATAVVAAVFAFFFWGWGRIIGGLQRRKPLSERAT